MLTKLLKYDWKFSYKIILIMNLAVVLMTGIGVLTLILKVWNNPSEGLSSVAALLFVFYILAITLVSSAAAIYVAVRFYRNMYTDEGYLMHTLPVSKHHLLLSKIIIGAIHSLVTSLVVLASISILTYFLITCLDPATQQSLQIECSQGDFAELTAAFAVNKTLKIILLAIYLIIASVNAVLLAFAAISLGQLFGTHKVIGSILCYVGLYTCLQFATTLITIPFTGVSLMNDYSLTMLMDVGLLIEIVLFTVLNVLLYFVCYYIMNKKLNLD